MAMNHNTKSASSVGNNGSKGSIGGFTNVFRSFTTSKTKSNNKKYKSLPIVINPTVVGGVSNQQELFEKLDRSNRSISERLETIKILTDSLNKFSISSIPEIWYASKDLLEDNNESNREIVLKLLENCIKNDDLNSVSIRLTYYNDIIQYCRNDFTDFNSIDQSLNFFLKALVCLTNNGSDIRDFCLNESISLIDFLYFSLRLLVKNYDNSKFIEVNLDDLIKFIINCFKLNFSMFDESEVTKFLQEIILLSNITASKCILKNCLSFMDILIIYRILPLALFPNTIEVLAGSYNIEKDYVWQIFENLTRNVFLHQLTINNLCNILSKDQNLIKSNATRNNNYVIVGSIQLLQKFIMTAADSDDISGDLLDNSMYTILENLEIASQCKESLIIIHLLKFFNELLVSDKNYSKVFKFQYWFSEDYSILHILRNLAKNVFINNDQGNLKEQIDENKTLFTKLLIKLTKLIQNNRFLGDKDELVEFLKDYISNLTEISQENNEIMIFILNHYKENYNCLPFNRNWVSNCDYISETILVNSEFSVDVKLLSLEMIKESFDFFQNDYDVSYSNEAYFKYINWFFGNIVFEKNIDVLEKLINVYFEEIALGLKNDDIFNYLIDNVIMSLFSDPQSLSNEYTTEYNITERKKSIRSFQSSFTNKTDPLNKVPFELLLLITKSLCKIFIVLSIQLNNGSKSLKIYDDCLIKISNFAINNLNSNLNYYKLLLCISKTLVRLRFTQENEIFITHPFDIDGLTATFNRNFSEEYESDRKDAEVSVNKDTLDWYYPEKVDYIPDFLINIQSKILKIDDQKDNNADFILDIRKWLDIVIKVYENFYHLEIYSFILSHFCPQLTNLNYFLTSSTPSSLQKNKNFILKLKEIFCNLLATKKPKNIYLPSNVTRADLHVCIIRNLTSLIPYNSFLTKNDQDQLINSLIMCLATSWEKTAIPAINCLNLCCYELPLSIKKYLSLILNNLTIRISFIFTSPHILEFLINLSHLPGLITNFSIEEFRRIFGICFKFIEFLNDYNKGKLMRINEHSNGESIENQRLIQRHGVDVEVGNAPSTQTYEITAAISQYLLALCYNVISSWFLKMKMDERKELSPFITRNLVLLTSFSNKNEDEEDNNDQIVGFLDLISRFTYSDIDLKLINFSSHEEQNKINAEEKVLTKEKEEEEDAILISRWIFGYSIISIETNVKNGHSTIVIRKPSGITILKIKPDPIMLPEYINSFHYSSSHVNATTEDLNLSTLKEYFFTPDFFVSEFYNNDLITRSGNNINEHDDIKPTLLCGNDQIVRGINNLDRIPIIEFHKAGIIYIGPNQSKELDILSNTVGSKNYLKFLNKLGYKIDLLNNTENYTGGLDIGSNATDGKFTYFWNDKINQMVFHIITLMPNNFANDEFLYNKKRHVGNNYVNIYYDESGLPFNFNVIKSQFNFINIVISPIVVSSSPYLENNIEETDTKRYYKVKVYRKKLIPAIFSACHFKIISEDKLSIFIRNLVLVCNQFSNVWNISEGKYVSNWSRRVKHIKKLRNLNEKEREKEKGKDNSV